MSPEISSLNNVSELIRLALTPAFMIAAVSTMLGVLSTRLGRVGEQGNSLKSTGSSHGSLARVQRSAAVRNIAARAWLLLAAMAMCVVCALLVTVVIALLYLANRGTADLAGAIGLLFVLAIAVLAIAMMCLLAEVGFASAAARNLLRDMAIDLDEPSEQRNALR